MSVLCCAAGEIRDLKVIQAAAAPQLPVVPPPSAPPTGTTAWGGPPPPPPPVQNPWGGPAPVTSSVAPPPPPPPPPPTSSVEKVQAEQQLQSAPKQIAVPAPTIALAPVPKGAENGAGAAQSMQQPNQPRPKPTSYASAAGAVHRQSAPQSRGGARTGGGGGGRGGSGGGGARGGGRGGTGGRSLHSRTIVQAPPPTVSIPPEEFDFEAALKLFDKSQLKKEGEEPAITNLNTKTAYKKDDFFDELSCEALEKLRISGDGATNGQDARNRAAARRRTDVETFGGAARGHGGRGRGRGRGHGGRGRGHGGRGRGPSPSAAPPVNQ